MHHDDEAPSLSSAAPPLPARAPRARRPLDAVTIALSLLAIGAFSAFAYAGGGSNSSVIIQASGETFLYPLQTDR